MENRVIYVRGCRVEIDLTYAVQTEEEKKQIIQNVSRIYAEHERKKQMEEA